MSGSILLLPVVVPAAAGIAMRWIGKMEERGARSRYVGLVLLFDLLMTTVLLWAGEDCVYRVQVTGNLWFVLRQDALAKLFSSLAAGGWMLNGFFSFEYMSKEESQVSFFSFYLITGGLLNGLAYAGGYSTMKLFYILVSASVIPLIAHRRTELAIRAAIDYTVYVLIGIVLVQAGDGYMRNFVTAQEFMPGGSLSAEALDGHEEMFLFMIFLVMLGYGVKACLFPFHGWNKMVSDTAPVAATSAISGILTKSSILVMIRILGNVVGIDILKGTWVQYAWMVLALASIFIGAVLAFRTKELAERMSYSTIGQVGCIVFGVVLMDTKAITGALVLMTAHTMAILALFFAVGSIEFQTGYTRVGQLRGIGRQIPQMMLCFALASCVLMGIPPTLGFVGDWNVYLGAAQTGIPYLAGAGSFVFICGELLAAGYLLEIILKGFFPGASYDYVHENVCHPSVLTRFPAYLLTALTYIVGFYPAPLLEWISRALDAMAL